MLGIKTVVEREFLALCDIIKRIKNDPPGVFAQGSNIGLRGMVDETGFVATKETVDAVTVPELHQAGEPNRIIESTPSLCLPFREQLSLVFDETMTPFNVLASEQAKAMDGRTCYEQSRITCVVWHDCTNS